MVLCEDQLEHGFTLFVVFVLYFCAPSKNCVKLLLASSCLSVRAQQLGSHWTEQIFMKFYI